MSYLYLFFAIILNSGAHFLLKSGAMIDELKTQKIMYLIGGLSFFGISVIFYFLALSKLKLSIAFPLSLGIGSIITAFLAAYFLNEKLTINFYIGLLFILLGTYFIAVLNTKGVMN